jgi:hypothetical protein
VRAAPHGLARGLVLADAAAVPTYEAIGDVSKTLETVLTSGLAALGGVNPPKATLHDLVTPPGNSPPQLTIFLYDIVEDPSARNHPPSRVAGFPQCTVRKPPIALCLRYMMTAWASDRLSEHRIIGRAVQVLYERSTMSGTDLFGSLANTHEAIKLTLAPISLDDRARVWDAIRQTYRLSVNYEVRVVHIDPDPEFDLPVPAVAQRIYQPGEVVE